MTSGKSAGFLNGEVVNIPNLLSFLRIALVPVFLWFLLDEFFLAAIVVLAVAGLTDFLDGYLARKLNQTTKLGKMLDPVADRLYIFATLLALSATGYVPWWLAGLVILRDVLMLVSLPILASVGYRSLPVHYLGKASTFALWGVALYWWSGFVYLWHLVLLIREERQKATNVNVSKRGA